MNNMIEIMHPKTLHDQRIMFSSDCFFHNRSSTKRRFKVQVFILKKKTNASRDLVPERGSGLKHFIALNMRIAKLQQSQKSLGYCVHVFPNAINSSLSHL